jgi:hypothetical protein
MRYLLLPLLALIVGCSTTEQYAYRINTAIDTTPTDVEFNAPPNKSRSGQGAITFTEVDLCADLEYQAYHGPLSNRRNLTGSIGTCDRQTGICAVYWLEYDACDITDTADIAVDKRIQPTRPKKSKIEQLQDAIDYCYSGAPKFGPQAPCEMYEDMLEKELMQ